MPASSLYDIAKARLVQHINVLEDVGDLPYSFLRPILRHIQNPAHLQQLEETCPQLRGDTAELWLQFIQRDVPNWDKKPHEPRDPRNWSKVYRKLMKDAETEKAEQEEKLKEQMRALQQNRDGNQTQILESRAGYDPSARARLRGSGGGGWGNRDLAAPRRTGKVVLDKMLRGMVDQKRAMPKATQMPAHLLQQRKGVVKQAPERLVRMSEAEAPNRKVISKSASDGVLSRKTSTTTTLAASPPPPPPRPTLRKVPVNSPDASQRPSLPPGHQYSPPKRALAAPPTAGSLKRRRVEPNIFLAKKRKM